MMAVCMLIGRLAEIPETMPEDKGSASLVLETDRHFREEDGTLRKFRFRVRLWRGAAEECAAMGQGTLIAVRGRLETDEENHPVLIGEKVSFLSRPQETEEES